MTEINKQNKEASLKIIKELASSAPLSTKLDLLNTFIDGMVSSYEKTTPGENDNLATPENLIFGKSSLSNNLVKFESWNDWTKSLRTDIDVLLFINKQICDSQNLLKCDNTNFKPYLDQEDIQKLISDIEYATEKTSGNIGEPLLKFYIKKLKDIAKESFEPVNIDYVKQAFSSRCDGEFDFIEKIISEKYISIHHIDSYFNNEFYRFQGVFYHEESGRLLYPPMSIFKAAENYQILDNGKYMVWNFWFKNSYETLTKAKTTKSLFNIGDKCIVFDCDTWMRTKPVRDSETKNGEFFVEGIIDDIRQDETTWEWLADIIITKDNRLSKGHFQSTLKKIE
jgi:hypothetical protein